MCSNINYCELGRKIRLARKKAGVTQETLAELCDISPGFLSHIENGSRILSLETLFRIAVELKVSFDYLLLDQTKDSAGFMASIDTVVQSANPRAYQSFCRTVKVLAEHIEEL